MARLANFTWEEDPNITGLIDLDTWQITDLVDNADDAECGKGKKIGHKKNKYAKMDKHLQTWHIKKKDRKKPKKGKGV